MIIKPPVQIAFAGITDTPAALIDLAPTLAGGLGIPVPASFKGHDLSPVVKGVSHGDVKREIYSEHDHWNILRQSVRGKSHKLIFTADTDRNTFGVPVVDGYELFNLEEDPGETHSSSGEDEEIRARLSENLRIMDRWMVRHQQGAEDVKAGPLSDDELEMLKGLGYVQ